MLNGVGEGIVLAVFAWALLRISGRQNSSTRFAVWFSMMVAISALPFFGSIGLSGTSLPSATHSAFQLPGSYAADIFFVWALIAFAGLTKIGFSFWQLRRLRRSCHLIDSTRLHPLLRTRSPSSALPPCNDMLFRTGPNSCSDRLFKAGYHFSPVDFTGSLSNRIECHSATRVSPLASLG